MNMEFWWECISRIVSMVLIGVTGYLSSRFVKPFVNSKCAKITSVTYVVVMLILYFIPYNIQSIAAYAVGAVCVFFALYLFDKRNIEQKIFLALMVYLLDWISHGIAIIPRNIIWFFLINSLMRMPYLQFFCYIVVEIIYISLSFFVLAALFGIIDKIYVCKCENMTKKELGLMLMTPLSVLAGNTAFWFYSNAYESDMGQYIWHLHSEYLWIKAFYQIVSFAAIIVTIVIYQRIKESYRSEKENVILFEEIEHTKIHLKEVERLYQEMRSFRHDIGNHIAALEHLILKNEPQETEKYIQRIKEQSAELMPEIKSGNPVSDMIFMEKQREALENGIAFSCDFHYPQGTNLDAFDVSVILNNALANALEGAAGSDTPFVKICSYQNKNVFIIEIINSFQKILKINAENGLPETTKSEEDNHGIGLVNIQKVARKYQGDIDIEQDGQQFLLSVLLQV